MRYTTSLKKFISVLNGVRKSEKGQLFG